MTKFEEELKKGNFVCSACQNCKKFVWPPSNNCNKCFGQVNWRPVSQTAKLVEFSKKDNVIFCLAEFEEEIRVMGSLQTDTNPVIGQELKLIKCSYNGNEEFVFQPK
jgi:hypothetical protein